APQQQQRRGTGREAGAAERCGGGQACRRYLVQLEEGWRPERLAPATLDRKTGDGRADETQLGRSHLVDARLPLVAQCCTGIEPVNTFDALLRADEWQVKFAIGVPAVLAAPKSSHRR